METNRERREGNLYSREALLDPFLIPRRRVVKQLIVSGSARLAWKRVCQFGALETGFTSFETTIYKYFHCRWCGVGGA